MHIHLTLPAFSDSEHAYTCTPCTRLLLTTSRLNGEAQHQPQSSSISSIGNYLQQTLIGQQGPANRNQASSMNPSSQVPFLALYSDNLFNPSCREPLVPSIQKFSLVEVHFSQNSSAYTQPPNTFPCVQTFCPDIPPHFPPVLHSAPQIPSGIHWNHQNPQEWHRNSLIPLEWHRNGTGICHKGLISGPKLT